MIEINAAKWSFQELGKAMLNLQIAFEKEDHDAAKNELDLIVAHAVDMGAAIVRLQRLQSKNCNCKGGCRK